MSIAEKINIKLKWWLGSLFWLFLNSKNNRSETLALSIGITTFLDRYESCFKDLIVKLTKLFPNEQIIVAVNGHFKKEEHIRYLSEITEFCKRFDNVELITHIEPVGLSKIWNELIVHSVNNRIMILNDDLEINPGFSEEIKKTEKEGQLVVINKSWSHFIISKNVFSEIGPFDEGLLELGGEDDDYAARCAIAGVELIHKSVSAIKPKLKNKEKRSGINSYGKEMSSEAHGYSNYNTSYLNEKWRTDDYYFDGAIHVPNRKPSYWKLKDKQIS